MKASTVAERTWPIGLLALYLLTPNHQYQVDALNYASWARDGIELFHPHHLLYNAFGFVVLRAIAAVHPVDALAGLTTVNALITVASVVLYRHLVELHTGQRGLANAMAFGYGITHGIWYMATAVEVYPMALLAELVALTLIGRAAAISIPRLLGIALASAVAMLFHQTAIFFVPAGVWLIGRRSCARAVVYALLALGITGATYLTVAYLEGFDSVRGIVAWLFSYTHSVQFASGTWGGGWHPARLAAGVVGILGAFVFPAFVWNLRSFSGYRPGAADLAPLVLAAIGVGLILRLWWQSRRAPAASLTDPERRAWSRALVLWMVLHALFTLWWESVNFEFWLMILPPFALCLAFALARLDPALPSVRRTAVLALALGLSGNLFATFLPDTGRAHNGWLTALQTLERAGARDGNLVLSNEPAVDSYVRYFGHRALKMGSIRNTGGDPAALERFRAELTNAERRDGAYLLETETRDDAPGLSGAEVTAFYAPHLVNATSIGTYFAYGRSWTIYRLHAPELRN